MNHAMLLDTAEFDALHGALQERGYEVVGPTVRDGAIVYDTLGSFAELPIGWADHQEAGTYSVSRRHAKTRFGYVVGPHSWKKYLHPPEVTLWAGTRDNGRIAGLPPATPPRFAFVGVRPCEIAAIAIQDRVFLGGEQRDRVYGERRDGTFIVAVNCTRPGGTCFCTSMGTGPGVDGGHDLAVTELYYEDRHTFLVEAGTEAGAEVLAGLPGAPATPEVVAAAGQLVEDAAGSMGRTLDTDGIKELLYRNLGHPRWEQVARRCLTCANCTMACPTCFCSTVEDQMDLDGTAARRVRRWDSCFTEEFSYIHGGPLRPSPSARYRQWMTHKLASWIDQFGTSGCVGCGRCITWCPVGIDITEEVAAIRETEEEARVRARTIP